MRRLAIIGGGYSAVALVLALVECRRANVPFHIDVFEPRETLGQGLAYAPWKRDEWGPLLNVPAGRMGATLGRPDGFATWWAARGGRGADFAPRADYGRYLAETLSDALAAAPWLTLQHHREAVHALHPLDAGWQLHTRAGVHRADDVVLAYGQEARKLPPGDWSAPGWWPDPWSGGDALDRLSILAPIVLIGSGLTAVDVWQRLALRPGADAAPTLELVSRHGWLPQGHRHHDAPPPASRLPPQVLADVHTAAGLMRGMRGLVDQSRDEGLDWRDVVGDLRPHTPRLWHQLPAQEQRRAARHGSAAWDTHRHRAAPQVAIQLDQACRAGRLRVTAARLLKWSPERDGRWTLDLRRRDGQLARLSAEAIINCTGPSPQACQPAATLCAQGLASGWYQPHPNGLGPAVDSQGRMLNETGRPRPGLWLLGPALRAAHWEATAVPELRQHAAAVAAGLLACESAPPG